MGRAFFAALAVVLAVAVGWPVPGAAHAVLVRTSLEGAPVRPGTPTTVALRFNSALEPALSQVVLVDAHGHRRPLDVLPTGDRAEMQVSLPALEPGSYALRYKVLAADGHVTESVVRFVVKPE